MARGWAVRAAVPGDAAAIAAVHEAAFPSDAEARLVALLVADGDAALSLVAERDGEVAAHVLFSRMTVTGEGQDYRAVALAPVAVFPARQRGGAGSALIREGHARCAAAGWELAFVLGDPAYYSRFGYRLDTALPFRSPYAGAHFMALALDNRLRLPESGEARHAPAFARL